ncbi:hypothetical protein ROHU_026147 [Labeo rohita]|uniref:Uncharacterized protein n=1 Tax=Labeo rohita TaxID=84645 RepID=A0A498MEF4_LABRO|nr:hypothetical protein ROHU_026147 [Labeo rohita]
MYDYDEVYDRQAVLVLSAQVAKHSSDETPDAILSKGGVTVKAEKASYIFNMCPQEDHLTPRPLRKKKE